ncbi:Replication protein A 32 kDa subunit [Orchesella cincta]|uniref:Replication protein A 32 kDa subunit n=1 Tax=Orchesella cincta TaxID=48709 RepID=A0A1D2MCS1_ORCCI|nr:Replication protein A 32 kDa subunit [Orchesella cincta]
MWGNNDQSFGGGGFLTSQGYESPQTGDKSKGRRSQNIMPVTCKQLLECEEDTYKVEGFEAHVVTLVGLVRSVETSTTKVSMFIEDQTGTMECVNYGGTDGDASSDPTLLAEGTYGRVVGALRNPKNQKYVIIFKSAPVTDMNEVTCHILEVIQNRMKLKKLREGDAQKAATSFTGGENTFTNSMLAGGLPTGTGGGGSASASGGVGHIAGFTANQNMVHRIICNAREESGIHKDQIIAAVKNKIAQKEIMEILDFLSNEGHVFSTVDDDHFKSTDSQYM